MFSMTVVGYPSCREFRKCIGPGMELSTVTCAQVMRYPFGYDRGNDRVG